MSDVPDKKVKAVVASSKCHYYQPGDQILFDSSCIDKEASGALCMVALNAIYPFVYAARRGGWVKDSLIQCPDCGECVEFRLEIAE